MELSSRSLDGDPAPDSRWDASAFAGIWLNRPLGAASCFVGWCTATVVFLALVRLLGGPSYADYSGSIYATSAIAHGQFNCAFPPGWTSIAPGYSVLSGSVAALTGIGKAVPYPSQASLGAHCSDFHRVIGRWLTQTQAIRQTARIGFIGFLVLAAGAVAFLRSCGRGRCGWEPATLVALACLSPVWMCVQSIMHPEDLVTMGLALSALACARTQRWGWAGVLVALAILTQQFALLVAIPLLFLVPGAQRLRFFVATTGAGLASCVTLLVVTSGRALSVITQGAASIPGMGGTVLWDTHLRGSMLFVASRLVPIALSVVLSWFAVRRLGVSADNAAALLSLVALSLSLRLVFEEAVFGYYFMALAVLLVLLDVVRGHVRDALVAWIVALTLSYDSATPSIAVNSHLLQFVTQEVLPLFVAIGSICMIIYRSRPQERPTAKWVWVALLACALVQSDVAGNPLHVTLAPPLWQILVVGSGMALAMDPLLGRLRRNKPPGSASRWKVDAFDPRPTPM